MSAVCYHCGKGTVYGRTHTHHRGVAGGRWKKRAPKVNRTFKPNLQRVAVLEADKEVRVRLCTKCIKRVKKDISEGVKPFIQIIHTPENIQLLSDSVALAEKPNHSIEKPSQELEKPSHDIEKPARAAQKTTQEPEKVLAPEKPQTSEKKATHTSKK